MDNFDCVWYQFKGEKQVISMIVLLTATMKQLNINEQTEYMYYNMYSYDDILYLLLNIILWWQKEIKKKQNKEHKEKAFVFDMCIVDAREFFFKLIFIISTEQSNNIVCVTAVQS